MRAALLLLSLLMTIVTALAAGPEMHLLDSGGARRGAGLLVFSDTGRMNLLVGSDCIIRNASIACGLRGYMTSEQFTDRSIQREPGGFTFQGTLPGRELRFILSTRATAESVRFSVRRDGELPKDVPWASYQMNLAMNDYAGRALIADGKQLQFPTEFQAKTPIVSSAKHVMIAPGDPRRQIEITCDTGISILDGRQFRSALYQISIGIDQNETIFSIVMPEGTREQLAPQLRTSRLGYSAEGLKEATMEWLKGSERPADAVRIEDENGQVFLSGEFGPTVSYADMQSDFASFGFPELKRPGKYKLVWAGGQQAFEIKPTLFTDETWAPTLDTFIPWQMCHANIRFAGPEGLPDLPTCHMDDGQRVPANFPVIDGFRSYEANLTRFEAGDMIPVGIGGWHDAGDYDINVHAAAHVVWKLALAWEEFRIDHDQTTVDFERQQVVAGRRDGVPDILQQVEWGARWQLAMQQDDGLVYPGIIGRPGQYTAAELPEKLSDGKPGTKDERHVYVDYQPDAQLAQAISLAAAGRVLKDTRPEFATKCVTAAEVAMAYFERGPDFARPNTYFDKRNEDGRDGAHAAALAELYLTTGNGRYLKQLEGMTDAIASAPVTWPAAYATGVGGWWYAPTVLARLEPRLEEGALKEAILSLCTRAVAEQAGQSRPRPWPFMWFHLMDWGNTGHALNRVFDAYYLQQVVPGDFNLEQTQREMLWIYGYRPVNQTVFVCGLTSDSPKYLYNGRLHGRYGSKPASVPGAVVPGMGGVSGADAVYYMDSPGNYYHNEACIYTAADYLFAVHALKAAGY